MNRKKPFSVALYGMDRRSYKTMLMFLQGPCKGIAVVTDELDAEIDIIDADHVRSKQLLQERKSKTPNRPIIVISLQDLSIEDIIYVKKPIKKNDLITALLKAIEKPQINQQKKIDTVSTESSPLVVKTTSPLAKNKPEEKKNIDYEERKKTSKHQTAMHLNEGSYSSYIGFIEGINFSDRNQLINASYNPKNYFMGYVQSSLRIARDKARILQLNSNWKPLLIFPHSHEVWLEADDKQLRAFAGITIKSNNKSMSLKLIDKNNLTIKDRMENFYDMDAFIWKLAVWTSKGRYPVSIDLNRPVFLKHWPNFTRIVITPHAMRVAALLVEGPRTLINIADSLKIKPQYVFIFISAANALGLVGQAERKADEMISPPEIKARKPKGILKRILGKLLK